MVSSRGVAAAALALLGPSGAWALGAAGRDPPVSPVLDPGSHKEFFGKDYPADDHPKPQPGHDTLPLQDESVYDKDYVKDENGPGDEWKREEEYEFLVKKMQAAKVGAKDAAKKEEETRNDLDAAKAAEEAAKKAEEERVSAAEEKYRAAVAEAEERVRQAKKKYDEALKKGPKGVGVAAAEKDLAEQKKKCEELEKELDHARARLQSLLAEKKAAASEVKETMMVAQNAVKLEAKKTQERDDAVAKFAKESSEYTKAHALYLKDLRLLNATQVAVKDAEAKLRGFRKTRR